MSYKSPVSLVLDSFDGKVVDNVYQVVNHYFVDVDKGELLKALRYDRDQYNRGRLDGYLEAENKIVRCKDCKYWSERYASTGYKVCLKGFGVEGRHFATPPNGYCYCGERKEIKE